MTKKQEDQMTRKYTEFAMSNLDEDDTGLPGAS